MSHASPEPDAGSILVLSQNSSRMRSFDGSQDYQDIKKSKSFIEENLTNKYEYEKCFHEEWGIKLRGELPDVSCITVK